MSIKQPLTQVRLTNVAVVRLKAKGKRYVVAHALVTFTPMNGTEKQPVLVGLSWRATRTR